MITYFAGHITGLLLRNGIINEERRDIYTYGFEIIISGVISVIIIIMGGILFSQFWESLLFLLSFVLVRKYCGGYHADTYLKCNIVLFINIIAVMAVSKTEVTVPVYIHYIICLLCLMVYIVLAPVENVNKPLREEEKKRYKKKAVFIGLAMIIVSSAVRHVNQAVSAIFNMALLSVAISMVAEIYRKGGRKHEEGY